MAKLWLIGSVALLSTSAAWSAGNVTGMHTSTPCQACQGADGVGISDEIPNLAGQKIAYLQAQLRAFKSGDRKHDVSSARRRYAAKRTTTPCASLATRASRRTVSCSRSTS
jgi:cytochrome c553